MNTSRILKSIHGMIRSKVEEISAADCDDASLYIKTCKENYNFFEKELKEELEKISDRLNELDHRTAKLRTLR